MNKLVQEYLTKQGSHKWLLFHEPTKTKNYEKTNPLFKS